MPQFLAGLLAVGVGLYLLFMAIWITIALLFRLVSFLVLYWMVSFTAGVVAGLLFGVLVPLRVLRGKGRATFRQLTPADVAAGTAFRAKPRGDARHFGWDHAWPTYFPYQARHDGIGVVAETRDILSRAGKWVRLRSAISTGSTSDNRNSTVTGKVGSAAGQTASSLPGIGFATVAFLPFAGFFIGTWISVLAWLALMFVVGLVVVAGQQLALFAYRWFDILMRRRDRAELSCTKCYAKSTLPSYKCGNPACSVIHRDLLPGPLGLRSRRCTCGTKLPNTIRRAGALLDPVCPVCGENLPRGSGNRQTIPVPVIGSVAAGKTRLLAAATVQLGHRLTEISGKLEGLTPDAGNYLGATRSLIEQHTDTTQTAGVPPAGIPLLLSAAGTAVEIQLMDAGGENFQDWDTTSTLRYLDQARALIYVLDPLPFPAIAGQLKSSGLAHAVITASGEQEESYAAAVDRMRAENVRLKDRKLAFVVTKADILLRLPAGQPLATDASLRDWLMANEFDLLVQRCEKDFAEVAYFLVDSMSTTDEGSRSPLRVLEWLLTTCRSPLGTAIAPTPEPVPVGSPEVRSS